MTSFNLTSIKKAISKFQEDFAQFPTQQKSDPLFRSDVLLCREDSASSACIRLDNRATPSRCSSVFKKNPDFLSRHKLERQLATVRTLGQHCLDMTLIRKRVMRVMEGSCSFSSGRSMSTQRTLNQC
jgi:hypothetical protein